MRRKILAVSLFAAMLLLACSLSSVIDFANKAKEIAPTAQALASQVGPTVEAAMTQVGPTMQAAMTQGAQMMTQEAPSGEGGGQGGQAPASNWKMAEDSSTLRSFHQEIVAHVKMGGQEYDLFKIESDYVRGQGSRQVIIQKGRQPVEIVAVGGKTWYHAGGEWMVIPSAQDFNKPAEMVMGNLGAELADAPHWKANGTATLNGMKVYRYVYQPSQEAIAGEEGWQSLLLSLPELQGATQARVTKVKGEISVLQDGTIVRSFYQVEGEAQKNGQQVPVEVSVTTTLSNLNGQIEITPPPANAGVKAPVPLPPGAALEMQVGTSSFYSVPNMTIAQVMQFFEQAFAQQGYTITTKVGDDQNGWTLQVTDPQGRTYMVMVAAEGGKVTITIIK